MRMEKEWGEVRGQTARKRLKAECLEANVRTVAFISFANANHRKLLTRCEMWSKFRYFPLTANLPQTQFHASHSLTTASCLSSVLPLETWLQWFFDPTRTSNPLISAPFSSPLSLDVLSLLLSLVKSYGQSLWSLHWLDPKVPFPAFFSL